MSQAQPGRANRLAAEKSPYLLQHAYNPVDWYPWGEEAFARARKEEKPIFLSIGYSTCHWCHVMERESFENERIAELMNQLYVCIKVDREERPDVDRVYMAAVQALTGAGGWPLSAWLTPELEPYYAGTYFPPETRHGTPGFPEMLQRLSQAWREQRSRVVESAQQLVAALRSLGRSQPGPRPELSQTLPRLADQLRLQLERSYDRRLGGFGDAPKFPRPAVFYFLLRHDADNGDEGAREMALESLRKMWAGGINDHLGGGFHRYSVDRYWRVPHFEKMLYDQAQILDALADAFASSAAEPFFAAAAAEVAGYLSRDMTDPGGAFHSAEDADSARDHDLPEDKVEGAFYLWTKDEVIDLLGEADGRLVCERYGVSATGNTLSDPHGEFGVGNVLYAARETGHLAREIEASVDEVEGRLTEARARMVAQRSLRPRPGRDDKIVSSWNGLAVSALARAAVALERPDFAQQAARAAEFILEHSTRDDGSGSLQLLRRFRDGEAAFAAQLDDYANLGRGLLDLYQATWDDRWLPPALALTERMIADYLDREDGAFFDSPPGDPSVLVRTKEAYDGAEPSGNAVACLLLLRLARLFERREWEELAVAAVSRFLPVIEQQPSVAPFLIAVGAELIAAPEHLVVCGAREDERTQDLLAASRAGGWAPYRTRIWLPDGDCFLRREASYLRKLESSEGAPRAYFCSNYSCELPVETADALKELLVRTEETT